MTALVDDAPQETRWWHLAVVGVSAVSGVVVTLTARPPAGPIVVWTALAVFLAAWFAFGRRTFDGAPGWQAFTIVIVAVGLAGALAGPAFATWQTIAFPLLWSITRTLRSALVVNTALAVAVGVGYAISTRSPLEALVVHSLS